MYQDTVLKNGLRIVTALMPQMESVTIGIWARVGGRYENQKIAGISHFIEHLLFKGTKTRSALRIKEEIESVGGSLNGFTGEEFTCYYAKVLKDKTEIGLNVLADMALNARLDQRDIKREKQVVIEEIKMYWDLPSNYVHDLLNELMWPNHPLGMYLAGSPETIESLTPDRIRHYKNEYYQPKNFLVAVAGAISHEKLISQCQEFFDSSGRALSKTFKKAVSNQSKPRTHFRIKQTEQTHFCLGFRSFGRFHPDRYALSLLSVILGGNMSSRLFQEIREKRALAYEIGSHVRQYLDTGAFVVSAGVENVKTEETVKVILQQLEKICKTPPPTKELEKAKQFYRGQFLLGLEDTSEHMIWLSENVLAMDKLIKPEEVLLKMEEVPASDIQRVAKNLFMGSRLNLAIIGPLTESQQLEIRRLL